MREDLQSIGRVFLVPVGEIYRDAAQPARKHSRSGIEELSASIKAVGMIVPLTLRRAQDGFVLVAGERRLMAAKLAGLEKVPSLILPADGPAGELISLSENLHREDMHFFEEAEAIAALMRKYGWTAERTAAMTGRSPEYISGKLRLLGIPAVLRARIRTEGLTEAHAQALTHLADRAEQEEMLGRIILRRLGAEDAAAMIDEHIKARGKRPAVIFAPRDRRLYVNPIKAVIRKLRELNADIDYDERDTPDACEIRIVLHADRKP